eukprot:2671283-Pyramimonas_sp.AAC.1
MGVRGICGRTHWDLRRSSLWGHEACEGCAEMGVRRRRGRRQREEEGGDAGCCLFKTRTQHHRRVGKNTFS